MSSSNTPQDQQAAVPGRNHRIRLYHQKSKKGCQRCKQRRVKCDEATPRCGACARHDVECIYHEPTTPSSATPEPVARSKRRRPSSRAVEDTGDAAEPLHGEAIPLSLEDRQQLAAGLESDDMRERRQLELRLLHNYLRSTSGATLFPFRQQRGIRTAWSTAVLDSLISHESFLYAVFALSAEHLATQADANDPESSRLASASRNYMILALSAQRTAVAELNSESAMAVCHASSLIIQSSFAMLRNRSMEPYEPPLNWFHMGQGTCAVFTAVFDVVHRDEAVFTSPLIRLINPEMQEPGMCDSIDAHGQLIFSQPDPEDNFEVPEVVEAYERASIYVSFLQRCVDRGDEEWPCSLRFLNLPTHVPRMFVDLLIAKRPRALAILARALSIGMNFTSRWWTAPARDELVAIKHVLPSHWVELI